MQHKTILTTWVTIDTAERMESAARERRTTVSALVREVLTTFVYGKPVPLTVERRGNRDRREDEALTVIRRWPHESCRQLRARLAEAGIVRGQNWVWEKRRKIQEEVAARA